MTVTRFLPGESGTIVRWGGKSVWAEVVTTDGDTTVWRQVDKQLISASLAEIEAAVRAVRDEDERRQRFIDARVKEALAEYEAINREGA